MKAYRTVLVSAAIYSVIIGVIYVTLAVFAILTRNCNFAAEEDLFNVSDSPFGYMFYLIYFRVEGCRNFINMDHLDAGSTITITDIPDETQATFRTFIFSMTYLALYGALIFTALLSLFGIRNSCLGRASFPIFFAPWIFVSISIIVMDVLATVFYIMDSIKTTSTDGLIELLELENLTDAMRTALENIPVQWRILPPIIMFLVTSKCFIFLVIDIVMITLITRAGWTASSYHKYVDESTRHYNNNMARTNPAFEDVQTDVIAQKQHERQMGYVSDQSSIHEIQASATAPPVTPDRYNDTSIQAFTYPQRSPYNESRQQQNYDQNQNQNQILIKRPNTLAVPVKYPDRSNSEEDRTLENRLSQYTESNGNVIRTVEPLKNDDISEQQQQQMRVRVLPTLPVISRASSEAKQKPKVPPKPQSNRNSMQPAFIDDSRFNQERPDSRNSMAKIDRTSSINAPEELRGQLPWSYFKARDDTPKKAFTELREDEELPTVPVPDYTLHFPKGKRANLGSSGDDESFNRYEQRN